MQIDELRQRVQRSFDRAWKRRYYERREIDPSYTRVMALGGRYKRLIEIMQLPRKRRIQQFTTSQCIIALDIIETGRLNRPRDGKK